MRPGRLIALLVLLASTRAQAWLLFEHDRIAAKGIGLLAPADRDFLQAAWAYAVVRRAPAGRYCPQMGQPISAQSVKDDTRWCAGFPALTALAGDHSCNPAEVAAAVETAAWMGPLLVNSRDLGEHLSGLSPRDVERVSAWREHNLAQQNIDPLLLVRAENNAAHFLPRLEGQPKLDDFLVRSLEGDKGLNAVAVYAHYHLVALRAASQAAKGCTVGSDAWSCSDEAEKQLRLAFLAEAFAQHFLEDSFAAGHTVGSGGDVGQRLGTHDYYSERGLDVRTWSGELYSAHGDAFITPEDERRSGTAIAESLAQLAKALRTPGEADDPTIASDGDLSVCKASVKIPTGLYSPDRAALLSQVVRHQPVPSSRDHGVPRFRSEVGLFIGLSLDASGFALFGPGQLDYSDVRLRLGIGSGLALEGAFSRFMDGQMFVDLLLVTSMHEYAVARRGVGFGFRIRMPFVVLPGDLLYLVGPVAIFNRELAYQLAQVAVAGGLGRLQRQIILRRTLSLQWMLGREVTASWMPEVGWQLDVPILQMSGDRLFSGAFAADTVFQVGGTVHWGQTRTLGGLVIGVSQRIRRYIPQDCQYDCGD